MTRRKLKDVTSSEVFEQRQLSDGRRKIKLRQDERNALIRQQRAEAAAVLFLDLETNRTWAQIAEELGLSPHQLRDLTKTAEFTEAYSMLFAEIGHDPRFRAAQAAVGDMLPTAIRQLQAILTSDRTPSGVRLKAIEKVLALNGLSNSPPPQSDREELTKFLEKHNINVQVNNFEIPVPAEFTEKLGQVIDVEVKEIEQPSDAES